MDDPLTSAERVLYCQLMRMQELIDVWMEEFHRYMRKKAETFFEIGKAGLPGYARLQLGDWLPDQFPITVLPQSKRKEISIGRASRGATP